MRIDVLELVNELVDDIEYSFMDMTSNASLEDIIQFTLEKWIDEGKISLRQS